jgi:Flp pilus assembly protein TadG
MRHRRPPRHAAWSIDRYSVPENFNQMIGRRRSMPVTARPGRSIFRIAAAGVVNGADSIAIKSAGLCLRGNEKSMCCKYERAAGSTLLRADPVVKRDPLGMFRNLSRHLRRRARTGARFCLSSGGATAVEFALIAPPFLALLIGILQMTSFLFAQQALQTAAVAAGRLILTGQVQNASLTQSQFTTDDVCPLLPALFTCSNLYVSVQSYSDFGDASTAIPSLTISSSGTVSGTGSYSLGGPGEVMVLQLVYPWKIITGPLGALLPNFSNGYAEIMGITAFRVEPY